MHSFYFWQFFVFFTMHSCNNFYMHKCLWTVRLYLSRANVMSNENMRRIFPPPGSIFHIKKHSGPPWGQSSWQQLSPMTGKICLAEGLHLILSKHLLDFIRRMLKVIYILVFKCTPVKGLLQWLLIALGNSCILKIETIIRSVCPD